LIITPSDKEIGKDVCVSAVRHRLESIAPDETATVAEPVDLNDLLGSGRSPRQIEYDTSRLRMQPQYFRD